MPCLFKPRSCYQECSPGRARRGGGYECALSATPLFFDVYMMGKEACGVGCECGFSLRVFYLTLCRAENLKPLHVKTIYSEVEASTLDLGY